MLANSEDQYEMQHNAAFHHSLHCLLLRFKDISETEIQHNLESPICDLLKLTMGSPTFIVSICRVKSISIQRNDNEIAFLDKLEIESS